MVMLLLDCKGTLEKRILTTNTVVQAQMEDILSRCVLIIAGEFAAYLGR